MLVAIPEWNNRISPVFDEALNFRIFRIEAGSVNDSTNLEFQPQSVEHKIERLLKAGVNIIICGAISRYVQRIAEMNGISVIPFIAGDVETVLDEWLSGNWQDAHYRMPGCGGRNRYRGNRLKNSRKNSYPRR